MKKILFAYLLSFVVIHVSGQAVWQAEVQSVDEKGYYNIEVDQHIIAKSYSPDLSDLRLLDDKNNEIPYFLRSVSPVQEISKFENYLLKQNSTKDSLNTIVIDNVNKEKTGRFYIFLSSAEVDKYASVRGSNDLKQWYVVKRKTSVYSIANGQDNNEDVLLLDIPEGNYRYYEITIENNQKSPLEVLRVGKLENSSIYGQFTEVDLGQFEKKDSINKKTYISFPGLRDTYKISRLEMSVRNDAFYLRNATLTDTLNRRSLGFKLSSKTDNSILFNNFSLDGSTIIVIENNNNQPLDISSIKAYGLNRYLCAYLEKGKKYYLQTGLKNSTLPDYDIYHFKNEIPSNLSVLKTGSLSQKEIPENGTPKKELSLIEKPVFLWSVIILIGLFLTFVCFKTIKEIKKKNRD